MKDLEDKLKALDVCYWKTVDNARTPAQRELDIFKPKENYCHKCSGYRLKCIYYYKGEMNT